MVKVLLFDYQSKKFEFSRDGHIKIYLYIYLGILTLIQLLLRSQKLCVIKLIEYKYLGILTIVTFRYSQLYLYLYLGILTNI